MFPSPNHTVGMVFWGWYAMMCLLTSKHGAYYGTSFHFRVMAPGTFCNQIHCNVFVLREFIDFTHHEMLYTSIRATFRKKLIIIHFEEKQKTILRKKSRLHFKKKVEWKWNPTSELVLVPRKGMISLLVHVVISIRTSKEWSRKLHLVRRKNTSLEEWICTKRHGW